MKRKKKLQIAIKTHNSTLPILHKIFSSKKEKGRIASHRASRSSWKENRATGHVRIFPLVSPLEILLVWLITASITPIKASIQSGEHFRFENLNWKDKRSGCRTNNLSVSTVIIIILTSPLGVFIQITFLPNPIYTVKNYIMHI